MQSTAICDIIIENTIKEWYSMGMEKTKDIWEVPAYSKKKVEKAGKILINPTASPEEKQQALHVLNNWRSSHAYPMCVIANSLIRYNPDALVAQRLKRLDSIVDKLDRFPTMSLYKMQDLGGCRVILDDVSQVYDSIKRYKSSRVRHVLLKEDDYIQNPKESGYRGYHAVYLYQSDNDNSAYNKNMRIEIQFRTRLQHVWATAVEIMGIYTKSQLKSSKGDPDVLRFFTLASSLIALKENVPVCPNTSADKKILISEMKCIDVKLKIIDKLSAISVVMNKTLPSMQDKGFYLLSLNFDEQKVRVDGFKPTQIGLATEIYNKLEASQSLSTDVVLVAATSLKSLREAYPNYFTDIKQFLLIVKEALNSNGNELSK